MPRYTKRLTTLALIGVTLAMVAAFAGRPGSRPQTTVATTPPAPRRPPPKPVARVDVVMKTALAYAAAARNWTAAAYMTSWRSQVELSAGLYRRALVAARPGQAELRALRVDGARSQARVLFAHRARLASTSRARVTIVLQESTSADGERIVGVTANEVRLRRTTRGWRVVGWTALPGIADAP